MAEMRVEYIKSFEQMLDSALAVENVNKARPMTDIEIQCLIAHIKKKQPHIKKMVILQDLEKTLFSMVELIKHETDAEQATYARKLLRRVGEVAINIDLTVPSILH